MVMDSARVIPRVSEVVVGLFTHVKNAKDAICDLSRAGFDASQVNVAYAGEAKGQAELQNAEHSIFWRLRDSFRQDLHIPGADQASGEAAKIHPHQTYPYTEVDLRTALSEIGVAPDRIALIENEIGDGVLLLVKGGGHAARLEEILERNEGTIRTDTALEAAPKR